MTQLKLKSFVTAIAFSAASNLAFAELATSQAVLNGTSDHIAATTNFATSTVGDLYVATSVGGQLLFLVNNGEQFSFDAIPLESNQTYLGERVLFNFPTAGIAPGRYPLYQVVTESGTSPLDVANWIGGLSMIHFTLGLPVEINGDFNQDGFADDDSNHDGFHDDDANFDGFHDDDLDFDGFHDDDLNHDGFHDAQGKDLYIDNCAACHGINPAQNINGVLSAIYPLATRSAINGNEGGMGYLNFLSDADLQAIADYVQNPQ